MFNTIVRPNLDHLDSVDENSPRIAQKS